MDWVLPRPDRIGHGLIGGVVWINHFTHFAHLEVVHECFWSPSVRQPRHPVVLQPAGRVGSVTVAVGVTLPSRSCITHTHTATPVSKHCDLGAAPHPRCQLLLVVLYCCKQSRVGGPASLPYLWMSAFYLKPLAVSVLCVEGPLGPNSPCSVCAVP